jgi:hypothetical protein
VTTFLLTCVEIRFCCKLQQFCCSCNSTFKELLCRCNLKVLRKKILHRWVEHKKFTQLPHQISNCPPLTKYILGGQFCIFLHLQKRLLLSYFSTHFPTLFLLFLKLYFYFHPTLLHKDARKPGLSTTLGYQDSKFYYPIWQSKYPIFGYWLA